MRSPTERLLLSGPARSAWRTVAPVLSGHLGAPTTERCPWLLSGGTLLAARWSWHRESTDLDIVVTDEASLSLWPMADRTGKLRQLDDNLASEGWALDPDRTSTWQRGYHHPDTGQALDLFGDELRPSMHPERTLLDTTMIYTAQSAQVLYGKLHGRGHRAPVRDLYDLAFASRCDRRALRTAVRHLEAATLTRNLGVQLQGCEQYREDATTALVNPVDSRLAADPAPAAAIALIDNFPAIWRVTRTGPNWCIETLNVHEQRLETLENKDCSDTGPEPGGPASELLRRTPDDSRHVYRDPDLDARLLALARTADAWAAKRG